MIHRLPTSEMVRPYVKQILQLTLKLLQTDNEENVLVCLRIIIDMHKQYRPAYGPDSEVCFWSGLDFSDWIIISLILFQIKQFISYVRNIYSDLPGHLPKIFEPRPPIRVKDLKELNIEQILPEIYTSTPVQAEKMTADGKVTQVNVSFYWFLVLSRNLTESRYFSTIYCQRESTPWKYYRNFRLLWFWCTRFTSHTFTKTWLILCRSLWPQSLCNHHQFISNWSLGFPLFSKSTNPPKIFPGIIQISTRKFLWILWALKSRHYHSLPTLFVCSRI
jgi:hypothetical protein